MSLISVMDVERLIDAVAERPALYRKDLRDSSTLYEKKLLWQEVYASVVKNWNRLSAENKIKVGLDVQRRWQNIRSCFSRELRLQKQCKFSQATNKRRKYIYYDKLLFLLPVMKERPETDVPDESESRENTDEPDDTTNSRISHQNLIRQMHYQEEISPVSEENTLQKIPFQAPRNYISEEKEISVSNAVTKQIDADTNFVLSLVPSLRALSDEQKLEAKIQILSIMQRIKYPHYLSFRSAGSSTQTTECQQHSSCSSGPPNEEKLLKSFIDIKMSPSYDSSSSNQEL